MIARFDFSHVMQALPANVVVLLPDRHYTIVAASDNFLKANARERQEVIGRPYFDAFPEPVDADTGALRLNLDTLCENRIDAATPAPPHPIVTGQQCCPALHPVMNANGELEAILLQLQETAMRSDDTDDYIIRLARCAAAAELGTFEYQPDSDLVVGNPAFLSHLFLPPDTVLTLEQLLHVLHPEDSARTRAALSTAIRNATPYDVQYRVLAADGRVRWLRAKGCMAGNAALGTASFNGITIDISACKLVEQAHNDNAEESDLARTSAEHASLIKDEFLSTLSHELRTPLNSILGWTQVLQRSSESMSDKAVAALAIIERSARQQARLIDDLLDASAIMAGNIHLNLQPTRCNDVISASVALSAPMAASKNIQLDVRIDEPGMVIEADHSRLQQILFRLLSNAIKFSANDSTVTIRQMTSNHRVIITITDSGQGIAPAFLPSLFARFSQADGSITRSHMGLGLGLSIVKSLIELHGGTVSATSQGIARGATFTIELPVLQAGLHPQQVARADRDVVASESGISWFADIVVVDDEHDTGTVIQEILQNAGATVRLASSAIEALAMISAHRPDLLISDIGMPQIDGYQLLHLLRKQDAPDAPKLPAIALTAFARPEDKHRAIDAGYLIHLAKPVESDDLVTAARLAVRRPSRIAGQD
ncbi:ATP-binding protein [Actimicrobium sp. CCI2.3]|uniref:hybrid sensor histidine kinase/response regulator n=2 Tax=Bacteria TaxID=2 RepID=UPI002AB37AC4|nr:ATP-binding protein [Actimicrobium sp. CCI2.3]MDY7574971.1 ATP-binding protein [Actimicrobium sp. CCI2.3]MEB0021458.1 ATP-binding protein [Actimicrobium sp. CCI2.3]